MHFFSIEPAQIRDAPEIAAFNQAIAWETERYELDRSVLEQGVMAVLQDPLKGFYVVVRKNNILIASLLITYEWSDWRAKTIWWIQSVFVEPTHRNQGIFRHLYLHIKELAKKNDVPIIRLYVEPNNQKAIQTYQKLGMKIQSYWVCEAQANIP